MTTRTIETPEQLREVITRLSPRHPFTDSFRCAWQKLPSHEDGQPEQRQVWYSSQHEHWLGWLKAYEGPGAYGRKDWSRSAQFVYNHVVNPTMLIYLAEALGIDEALLKAAAAEALTHTKTMSAMSGAIRRVIPWPIVEGAIRSRS